MLTLLGRPGCHLCMDAAELLDSLNLSYHGVDIDDDIDLSARFGLLIPVIQRTDGATLNFPFDAEAILAFQCTTPLPPPE
jgi:hypothetical protein